MGKIKMENIKELRKEKKLTQTDCALFCGVSLTAFILWEKGVNKPTPENQKKLEKLLSK